MPALACRPLADLAPGLLGRDAAEREAVLLRAEALHDSLEGDATYPVDYLAFRLSGLRRDRGDAALLAGAAVGADLRKLIDTLSRGLDLPPDPPRSRVADDWAAALGVAPRTLARWRKDGLRWRWLAPRGAARRQIGFTHEAIEHHRRSFPGRLEAAAGFSQLPAADRAEALRRAGELAAGGASLSAAAAQIAAGLGRAHETVRQLLLREEAQRVGRGEAAVFPATRRPLDRGRLREIRRAGRRGEPITAAAARLGLKPAAVRRALASHRAAVALRLPLRLAPAPAGRPPAEEDAPPRHPAPLPPGLPGPLAAVLAAAPPGPAEARRLAAACRDAGLEAGRLRESFRPSAPPPQKALDAFAAAVAGAAAARRRLVAAAVPELVSVARRHLPPGAPAGPLIALLDAGLDPLLTEVARFDPAGPLPLHRVLRNRLLRVFAREDAAGRAHRRDAAERLWRRLRPLLPREGDAEPRAAEPPA
ncbi:hypothetical protein PSMK_13490 [Phycisphaera mikurensis NBRC 102666]|uniref:Uncharacterized protein n=1 Tax=Phycisphaera mikurensis (strain NBRC 102666 / KCTC 22515 / FYK2301M01) TaxID=1142394 RepID=I0IE20_PHYMF|nr:hypothetical protein PSMK_13490 [Phycisphaera mikurensis NBRC 102666]